jgi:hypothetical protein
MVGTIRSLNEVEALPNETRSDARTSGTCRGLTQPHREGWWSARASSRPSGLGSTLDRLRRPNKLTPGWSVYGAKQAQPVAISGKSPRRGKRQNKPNLLPCVATGCRGRQMVRRGSTVRVRQRA